MNISDWRWPDLAAPLRKVRNFIFFREKGIAFLIFPARVHPRNGDLSWYEEGYRRPYTGWLEFVRYYTVNGPERPWRLYRPLDQKE